MDAERFDRLSRQVARQSDRRSVFKAVAGGLVGALGVGAVRRNAAASGFEGDTCYSGADCRDGLVCENSSRGLLGGALAGTPYGPPGTDLALINGKAGRCRYHQESCGREGQACKNNGDCCAGFTCPNNHCRRE